MPTGDAYSSGHLVLSLLGLAFVLLVENSDILYRLDIIPVCDIIPGLNIITESEISPNIGFHRESASAVACQQGTLTPPDTRSCPFWDLHLFYLLLSESEISPNIGFHRASATGVACQQGTRTPPDLWSCPTLGLACVLMSRPISPELVLSPEF